MQPGIACGVGTNTLCPDPVTFTTSPPQETAFSTTPQGTAPGKLHSDEDEDESGKLLPSGSMPVDGTTEARQEGDGSYELEDEATHLLC